MADVSRALEREVKFAVEENFTLPDLAPLQVGDVREVVLTADYWDTADLRLLRWGHTVRHRRASDGSEDGWTVKLATPASGALGSSRDELELAGPPDTIPSTVTSLVAAFVRRDHLSLQARVVTVRRSMLVVDEAGRSRVELADDRVTSTLAGEPGPNFRQLEIEVVGRADEPAEALLTSLAGRLTAAGAGPAASTPKLALVLGDRLGPPEVEAPPLDRRSTVTDLVRSSLATGVRRLLLHDPYVRLGDDPEAIHQARVATRRLRADLRTLSPLLEAAPVTRWRAELRWLGGLLGGVRDLDVLEARLTAQIEALAIADPPGGDGPAGGNDSAGGDGSAGNVVDAASALLGVVRGEREVRRAVLLDVLGAPRYRGLLDDLVAAASEPPLGAGVDGDERAAPAAARLARHSWRRLARAARRAGDDASDLDLHEVRKLAKQSRYAAELADAVLAGGTAALAERPAAVQGVLGDLQDAVVAAAWLAEPAHQPGVGAAFLAGRLYDCQVADRSAARGRWPDVWRLARRRSLRRVL